jgi:hypothetical protein
VSIWSVYCNPTAYLLLAILACHVGTTDAQTSTPLPPNASVQPVSSTNPAGESVVHAQDESPVAESFVLPAQHHCWARFPAGSWREIQTTTETFDEAGAVVSRSVTTQRESLQSASDQRYALDVQATVDLVGKRITGKQIGRVLNTATNGAGQIVSTHRLEDESLSFADRTMICQVWEVTYNDDARSMVDRIYYAPEQFPYILRRETSAVSSAEDGSPPVDQVQSVVAVEVPFLVEGQVLPCACLETTRRGEKGSSVRLVLVSEQIPGGEVAVWSTDFDTQGQRSRWSSQELVDYGQTKTLAKPAETRRETRRSRRQNR